MLNVKLFFPITKAVKGAVSFKQLNVNVNLIRIG
jgi:hypothetical protein